MVEEKVRKLWDRLRDLENELNIKETPAAILLLVDAVDRAAEEIAKASEGIELAIDRRP